MPSADLDKVIILLTDGDNTQNRWTAIQADIDARTEEGLRQRQGGEHQALHGPRDRRERDAAADLRDQAGHVLQRAERGAAQRRVHAIAQNLANLRIAQVSRRRRHTAQTKARPHGRAFFRSAFTR